jgi:hypothetical protein
MIMSHNNERQNNVDDSFATDFYAIFRGRTDKVGLATSLSTDRSSEGAILQDVRNHLDGNCRLGFYNLLPDGRVPWAMIECEAHGSLRVDNPSVRSLEVARLFTHEGISIYREISKYPDGNAYHNWIFFETPISAEKVHVSLNALLKSALGIHVEVFPKGHDPATIGNFVWLPMFGGQDEWGIGVSAGRTVFIDDSGVPYPDQWECLKSIKKTTEAQLDALIAAYRLPTQKNVLVGKQPAVDVETVDLAKVRECSFMKHCEDNAADLPEPLWYAWITNAIRCTGGREYVHTYSQHHPQYSRHATDKKIAHAINDTGPMTHRAIADLGFSCSCPAKFKAPISRGSYVDISVEVGRIKALANLDDRAEAIRKLMSYWRKLDEVEQDVYRDLIKKELGLTNKVFSESKRGSAVVDKRILKSVLADMQERGTDDVTKGRTVYEWLKEHKGAQYFLDEESNHYVFLEKKLILMDGGNNDFSALLLSEADISTATQLGRVTVQVMQDMAHSLGRRIRKNAWLETNQEKLAVYLNLKNECQQLLKITPDACTVIQNGDNADGVFMINTFEDKLKAMTYVPMTDAELGDALDLSEALIVNHMPCAEVEKWFAYAWRMSYQLYDFTTAHITLRLQGRADQGKTTVCKLLSCSLYGEVYENGSTIAGLYSDASINPLIIDDNLENGRFYGESGHADFYLSAATGGGRQKRDSSTSSGLVIEKIRALLLSNGIESIAKSEQTSRMMIFECDRTLYDSGYSSAVLLDIKRNRNKILSANCMLTQRVLKRIATDDWQKVQGHMAREFKHHPKSRMFEHFAVIIMYLEEYFRAAAKDRDVWAMVSEWMNSQRESAITEIVDSDPIIRALDLIRDSAWKQFEYDRKNSVKESQNTDERTERERHIKLDVSKLLAECVFDASSFSISATAGNMLSAFATAFQVHAKKSFAIEKPKILVQRLSNILPELKAHGYELKEGVDKAKKQKVYTITWVPGAA